MYERLISQLAHAELISPKPQESVDFLVDVMGMEENGRDGLSRTSQARFSVLAEVPFDDGVFAVLYAGERCLGGGVIEQTRPQ